jgi:signal transduction histidine kinase
VFDKDPVRARDAVVQVGVTARSSLAEMRRVIGVLESGSENPAFSAQAGFADIPELIAVYRKVGLPVELVVTGEAPAEAGVQLAVFRVVQEALTNALRYSESPSAVSVRIDVTRDVEVLVVNDGVAATRSPVGSGRGVLGMRERAALYGGTVECGAVGEDSWRVRMLLPGAGREQSR